jgi:hypothetical protein
MRLLEDERLPEISVSVLQYTEELETGSKTLNAINDVPAS